MDGPGVTNKDHPPPRLGPNKRERLALNVPANYFKNWTKLESRRCHPFFRTGRSQPRIIIVKRGLSSLHLWSTNIGGRPNALPGPNALRFVRFSRRSPAGNARVQSALSPIIRGRQPQGRPCADSGLVKGMTSFGNPARPLAAKGQLTPIAASGQYAKSTMQIELPRSGHPWPEFDCI